MTRPGPESPGARRVGALHRASLVVAFSAMGVVGATVPASIPGAALRLGSTSDQLLPGVSALFLGLFAGVALVAALRRADRSYLIGGLLLQSVGLALLAASATPAMFFLACATSGVGFGFVETSATALTRGVAVSSTPRHLAILNAAAAVGAALSPLVIAAFPPLLQAAPIAILCSVPFLGAVIAWFGVPRPARGPLAESRGEPEWVARPRAGVASIAVAGVAVFLFVGAETVVSGWSSVLPQTVLGATAAQAALGTSVFWVLVAAGRLVCAGLLRRGVSPQRYLIVVLAGASAFAVAAAIIRGGVAAVLFVAAAIVLIAPVYALLLGLALTHVQGRVAISRATAALIAVGPAGGVVISFVVALGAGSAPAAVFLSVAVLLAACLILVVVDLRRARFR